MSRDLHSALRTEILGKATEPGIEFVLASLQRSKTVFSFTLHAKPNSYSTSGLQTTDALAHLGFRRGNCVFLNGECYAREVGEDLALESFAQAFGAYHMALKQADGQLASCGLQIEQPEGWGFFQGRPSGTTRPPSVHAYGDGHTAPRSELLKQSEDDLFRYALSWIESDTEKGWIAHYRSVHGNLSPEVRAALDFLGGFNHFEECPMFDFDSCHWRYVPLERTSESFRGTNVEDVHQTFDAHATYFTPGIRSLLVAQRHVQPFGMYLLEVGTPTTSTENLTEQRASEGSNSSERRRWQRDPNTSHAGREVFICHASEDKAAVVEPIVREMGRQGITHWYDQAEIAWGDSLTAKINEGLQNSRYVIVVLSQSFISKNWPKRELNAALNLEAASGEVKVLPLVCGTASAQEAIISQFPLLNDKLHLVWEGSAEAVVERLQQRLSKRP